MIRSLLSAGYPRSRLVAAILLAIVLALAPFLFPGARSLAVAAKILVFVLLVASYDLLLGYTGIVSFAHTMFFGIGAHGVAIASTRMGPGWDAVALGLACVLPLFALLALVIGLFSLRVNAPDGSRIGQREGSVCRRLAAPEGRVPLGRRDAGPKPRARPGGGAQAFHCTIESSGRRCRSGTFASGRG